MKTLRYSGLILSGFLIISFIAITGCKEKTSKPADSNAIKQPVGTGQRRPIEQMNAQPVDGNEVAVTVNGVNITEGQIQKEITRAIEPEIERLKKGSGGQTASADVINMIVNSYMKQLREPALQQMILRNLLDPKVKEAKITVTNDEVEKLFKERIAIQDPNMNLDDIKKMLADEGRKYEDVLQQFKEGLVYEKFIDTQIGSQISVTEADAKKFYDENQKTLFERPEQVRASHILIKSEPNEPNDVRLKAKEKIQNILAQLKAGGDFAQLAKLSEDPTTAPNGGDLGYFDKGTMEEAFEKAAFSLPVGQLSDIVETRYGYHILKVTDHKEAGTLLFEKVQKDIMQYLKDQKESEASRKYSQSLIKEAKITFPKGKELKTGLFAQ